MIDEYGSSWIQLADGSAFDYHEPKPISIAVIARSLARTPRFAGHTREPYSVAQHSVNVSRLVPVRLAAHGLVHDAAEAVIGDMCSPLKRLLDRQSGGWLHELERRIHTEILRGLGLPALDDADERAVKEADETALAIEIRDLMEAGERSLQSRNVGTIRHHSPILRAWPHAEAETAFLERWREVSA